jgi:hypothetical protein
MREWLILRAGCSGVTETRTRAAPRSVLIEPAACTRGSLIFAPPRGERKGERGPASSSGPPPTPLAVRDVAHLGVPDLRLALEEEVVILRLIGGSFVVISREEPDRLQRLP